MKLQTLQVKSDLRERKKKGREEKGSVRRLRSNIFTYLFQ